VTSGPEHRRHSRRLIEVEIRVGDTTLDGALRFDSRDFSAGGVFLKSELLFEPGEVLWLAFVLPDADLAVRTRGRVVWVRKEPGPEPEDEAGMGIAFLDLDATERAALEAYLESSD